MSRARHVDCTMEQYHSRPEWSRSQVEVLRQSAALFEGTFLSKVFPGKASREFDIGTVAHACLLEPEGIEAVCREIPDDVLNAQGHRKGADWLEFKNQHEGLILLKADEIAPIRRMIENVRSCPAAARLLEEEAFREHSIVWHDDDSGLDLRARPDLACHYHDGLVVVDFKTTRAVTARAFGRDAAEWGYHRQAAWYWDAVEEMGYVVHGFAFLCVDKSPAHECHVYELPAEALEHGRRQNLRSRRELFWRLERNDWTSPTADQIQVIDLPVWAYHEE